MIKRAFTFTDATGEHICHKAGRKVIVDVPEYAKTLREELIHGVRTATNDSSVRPDADNKLFKNPQNNSYVLKTASCFYFVRKRNSRIEVIVDETYGMGFYAGLTGHYKFNAYSSENVVVFWMIDTYTGRRFGHYNYFEW